MNIKEEIEKINKEIYSCKRCPLYLTKTNYVPGDGNPESKIMFIGEAPGRDEDLQGKPFVGKAGQYLTKVLKEIVGFEDRSKYYITNVVKCRPPNNREPKEEEIKACSIWLERQLEIIKPDIIVTLGNYSTKWIFDYFKIEFKGITKHRGNIYNAYKWNKVIIIFPMLHPAATLYNNELKDIFENDVRKLKEIINNKDKFSSGILKFFNDKSS